MSNVKNCFFIILFTFTVSACSEPEISSNNDYQKVDALFDKINLNVLNNNELNAIQEIDHSRLGLEAGSAMPPSRVLIFSEPTLDAALIKINPQTALELPLRILAFQEVATGKEKIIYNAFDYIRSRFQLGELPEIANQYNNAINQAINGIPANKIKHFSNNEMQPDGIITITSPYDFTTTQQKVIDAINSQDDTVSFGEIDFQARALKVGIKIPPNTLILFGGPAPGAKAMNNAPTLGLDAFCQKFLIWEDNSGLTHLSFNDLISLAERQDAEKSLALRVINRRLTSVFEEALE